MRRENKTNRSILEKSAAFSAEGLIFRERAAILIIMICRGGGMADAVDSKSTGFDHAGSSPALGTTFSVVFPESLCAREYTGIFDRRSRDQPVNPAVLAGDQIQQ